MCLLLQQAVKQRCKLLVAYSEHKSKQTRHRHFLEGEKRTQDATALVNAVKLPVFPQF
jgi:hypothetical protein